MMNRMAGVTAATAAWQVLLGPEGIVPAAETRARFCVTDSGDRRDVPLVLRPSREDQIAGIVTIAARHHVSLYPVSLGRNWGYGCASPVQEGCVVLDLSRLNRILACDAELGIVTVEPGVTQQQLCDYLEQQQLPFMVPTSGAGPTASLVGNALERGYGITPYADHFGAVTALEAVLADGSHYRSALTELGGAGVDTCHKWGIGPYLDGIFTQSNFGIVTRMSIALARKPEHSVAFFFWLKREQDLEPAVLALRDILSDCGGLMGSVNLLNGYRTLSMTSPYPFDAVAAGEAISPAMAQRMLQDNALPPWVVMGAVYGDRCLVRAAMARIRRQLRPLSRRYVSFSRRMLNVLHRLATTFPRLAGKYGEQTGPLLSAFNIMEGIPDDIALRLVYWKSRAGVPADLPQGMEKREQGVIWYAPLIPMTAKAVRDYVEMVNRVCLTHGMEPLITLTSLSNRCFDSSVPLLFDLHDANQIARAKACYRALFEAGKALGLLPYRMGIDGMDLLVAEDSCFFDLVQRIKHALDPQQILAPGRYARGGRAPGLDCD